MNDNKLILQYKKKPPILIDDVLLPPVKDDLTEYKFEGAAFVENIQETVNAFGEIETYYIFATIRESAGKMKKNLTQEVREVYTNFLTKTGEVPIFLYLGRNQIKELKDCVSDMKTKETEDAKEESFMGMTVVRTNKSNFIRVGL